MNKNFTVVTYCPFCGRPNEIEVNKADFLRWKDGELAQVAFPYLSAEDREMLISGICPECWNGMFGDEDEDEDWDEDWGYNEDEGFDPYEGCWTGDC